MPLKFEKVDDILTDKAREELINKHSINQEWIKTCVIDLITIANSYNKSSQLFDSVVAMDNALNIMAGVLYEYDTAYSLLLEKYQEATKETE